MKKEVFNSIIEGCPNTAVEIGGILGAVSDVVTEYVFDEGKAEYGKYTPSAEMINNMIFVWSKKDIDFCGIYHSHYPENERLSQEDVEYIKRIMISVSSIYKQLYFPIVIPKKNIISYKAQINDSKISITHDALFLTD